jgi:hypothetical protein
MGSKQLTADSMYAFYAYYNQNIALGAPVAQANFSDFVTNTTTGFLVNGQLAYQGALWYWMKRINGQNSLGFRPIHEIVNDVNKPVCQDIATVTRMVNGGCNDYDPGRLNYYHYFNNQFQIPTTPIIYGNLNSLVCNADLQAYCEKA